MGAAETDLATGARSGHGSVGTEESGLGEPDRAARLLGAAVALRETQGIPLPPIELADLDGVIAGVRADFGEAAFASASAVGQAMPLEQVVAEALQEAPVIYALV